MKFYEAVDRKIRRIVFKNYNHPEDEYVKLYFHPESGLLLGDANLYSPSSQLRTGFSTPQKFYIDMLPCIYESFEVEEYKGKLYVNDLNPALFPLHGGTL